MNDQPVGTVHGPLEYEGKAKRVYAFDERARGLLPDALRDVPASQLAIVEYKDDATAFNAVKRGTIEGKGVANAAISAVIMQHLSGCGVPTHFVASMQPGWQLVRRVDIVPIEVVVRNRAAGSFAKRYGVEEGYDLDPIVVEWCLKDDALGDPPMNDATAVAIGAADEDTLHALFDGAVDVNDALIDFFAERGLDLIDFKLEFGVDANGDLLLADEVSPDTCRLWDVRDGRRLDKDRFRRDLGDVEEAYQEVLRRVAESRVP